MKNKKIICYLADAQSPHTQKWATHFVKKNYEVHIISFNPAKIDKVTIHYVNIGGVRYKNNIVNCVRYLLKIFKVIKIIKDIQPNILHAHYATRYGLVGALSGFHPFIISVWGSDIFEFPNKSILHRKLLEFILEKADYLCSTSKKMKSETCKYLQNKDKDILVIPFGVDITHFPKFQNKLEKNKKKITIGTIKLLEKKYGIEYLIRGFAILNEKYPQYDLNLLIIGSGSLKDKLEKLVVELKILNKTKFVETIPHHQIPQYLNKIDIFVVASIEESFGVVVVEASACGIPVVVSNIGGLSEVVIDGETGFLFPPKDTDAIVELVGRLIENPELRRDMGLAGRDFVLKNYDWNENISLVENLYLNLISKTSNTLN